MISIDSLLTMFTDQQLPLVKSANWLAAILAAIFDSEGVHNGAWDGRLVRRVRNTARNGC